MELFSGQSDIVTAWQYVNAVCLGCLTHGAFVGHWTADYSAMEATGSACKRRWLECCHLSMLSPRPVACAGPASLCAACLYIITRPDSSCVHVCIFCDFLCLKVRPPPPKLTFSHCMKTHRAQTAVLNFRYFWWEEQGEKIAWALASFTRAMKECNNAINAIPHYPPPAHPCGHHGGIDSELSSAPYKGISRYHAFVTNNYGFRTTWL